MFCCYRGCVSLQAEAGGRGGCSTLNIKMIFRKTNHEKALDDDEIETINV